MSLTSQQRAYLTTMGITQWSEQSAPDPVETERPESEAAAIQSTPVTAARSGEVDISTLEWADLKDQVSTCTACELHKGRTQSVFGVGNQQADLMFVGEAPGADEDRQGEPFVGRAGQLQRPRYRSN